MLWRLTVIVLIAQYVIDNKLLGFNVTSHLASQSKNVSLQHFDVINRKLVTTQNFRLLHVAKKIYKVIKFLKNMFVNFPLMVSEIY